MDEWLRDFLATADSREPSGMTTEEHALELAYAIQRFRNEPALGPCLDLRSTEAFGNLCRAWNAFVADFPVARLPYDAIK